jgi:molybdopterin-binding protein
LLERYQDSIALPAGKRRTGLCYNVKMPLSARNQLPGIVQEVQVDSIMARIVVKIGDNVIESVITRQSADELALKQGDAVRVVVKSTEVMIQKD